MDALPLASMLLHKRPSFSRLLIWFRTLFSDESFWGKVGVTIGCNSNLYAEKEPGKVLFHSVTFYHCLRL